MGRYNFASVSSLQILVRSTLQYCNIDNDDNKSDHLEKIIAFLGFTGF